MPFNKSYTSLAMAIALPALLAGCGGSSNAPVAQAPHYTFTELIPPNGNHYVDAVGINAGGQVLVNTRPTFTSNQHQAYIYANGAFTDLNPIDPQHNTTGLYINDAGKVVYLADSGNTAQLSIYSGGTGASLPADPLGGGSVPFAFANDGSLIVHKSTNFAKYSGGSWTTVTTPSGFTTFQPLGFAPDSSIIASTDQGIVVGGGTTFTHYGQIPAGTIELNDTAFVNAHGQIAGNAGSDISQNITPWFGVATSGLRELPAMPNTPASTATVTHTIAVTGISGNGSVVGLGLTPGASQYGIILWINGEPFNVTPEANLPALHNQVIVGGISDNGTISAWYVDSIGQEHAFIMTPTP